jgi:hypothetical protein
MYERDDEYVDTEIGEADWCNSGINQPSCSTFLSSQQHFFAEMFPVSE